MTENGKTEVAKGQQQATVLQAMLPVGSLIALLSFSVFLFGEDASYGPNQIALCIGAAVAKQATLVWSV